MEHKTCFRLKVCDTCDIKCRRCFQVSCPTESRNAGLLFENEFNLLPFCRSGVCVIYCRLDLFATMKIGQGNQSNSPTFTFVKRPLRKTENQILIRQRLCEENEKRGKKEERKVGSNIVNLVSQKIYLKKK